MIMKALEFWGYEVLSLMSGLLGQDELGASVILFNVDAFIYMIPLGISLSLTSLIGNSLGANRPDTAKLYVNISMGIAMILALIVSLVYFFLRTQIAEIFTSDPELIRLIVSVFPVMIFL